jgi:hypothetical protein
MNAKESRELSNKNWDDLFTEQVLEIDKKIKKACLKGRGCVTITNKDEWDVDVALYYRSLGYDVKYCFESYFEKHELTIQW